MSTKIGDYALAPDFTAYDKLVYYQTYDITPYLKNGKNSFDIILADGWYAGHAQEFRDELFIWGKACVDNAGRDRICRWENAKALQR